MPFLESGDAIGDHAQAMAQALGARHGGYIVERASAELASQATAWRDARLLDSDVAVYHVAHGSPMAGWFRELACVKVVDYHGITPPALIRGWDAGLALALDRAQAELASLASCVSLALAHSEYMQDELETAGFHNTQVLPLNVDRSRLATPPNPALLQRLQAGNRGHDLLFVSRMAPNKRIEDVIKCFAIYRRGWCPHARLFIVGRPDSGLYAQALEEFARRLGVEEIHFAGKVAVPDLMAYYRSADLFVSMSEHEGFGVPWIEAMALGLPVVAFAAGALPQTVGNGGLLFGHRCYEDVAALIHLVLTESPLRSRLVGAGLLRAEQFTSQDFDAQVRSLIPALTP